MSSQTSSSNSQHLQSPMRLKEPVIPSPHSERCDVRFSLVKPVRLDILVELGDALFVGIVRESDGGRDGACACPTSRPRFLDRQHNLADDRGNRGAGCDDEERDVWHAQIVHPLLVRVLLALEEEKQIASYVLQRSKQARIRRGTEEAGLTWQPVPKARNTARLR
jgi:hypothetical protein